MARADTIRYINRQIVLNYIREKEPISRADISHETALQRSTVSLIVAELKTRGLIYEVEGESRGGRPPTLLRQAEYATIEATNGTIGVQLRRVTVDRKAMAAAVAATDNPINHYLLEQYKN